MNLRNLKDFNKTVKIWTDGACSGNPGPGGWGAVIIFPEKEPLHVSGFEKQATNNRMELMAVIKAIETVRLAKVKRVIIYSDSAYVCTAINSLWPVLWEKNGWRTLDGREVKNRDLWEEMILQLNYVDVAAIKIKGHSNLWYNDLADKLARQEIETNMGRW